MIWVLRIAPWLTFASLMFAVVPLMTPTWAFVVGMAQTLLQVLCSFMVRRIRDLDRWH